MPLLLNSELIELFFRYQPNLEDQKNIDSLELETKFDQFLKILPIPEELIKNQLSFENMMFFKQYFALMNKKHKF